MTVFFYLNCLMVGMMLVVIWMTICSKMTANKREHLIDNWYHVLGHPNAGTWMIQEFELVSFQRHCWRLFFFRSAKSLYGPLVQSVWTFSGNCVTRDEDWWDCYQYVYLKMAKPSQDRVRRIMAYGSGLKYSLDCICNIPHWIEQFKPESQPKFSMNDGVEEYEAAMAAQELMQ